MEMIKAKRQRGNTVHERSFTDRQWNSKTGPQTKGWVLATSDLQAEKKEANQNRSNSISSAIQEELSRVSGELASVKSENETLLIENSELKGRIALLESENKTLEANQKGKPGRKSANV